MMNTRNPVHMLREEAGYSQSELASHLGITEQTIRRSEQGTFLTIPASIIRWAEKERGISPTLLHLEYAEWRVIRRHSLVHNARVSVYPLDLSRHPFVSFREKFMDNYLSYMSVHKDTVGNTLSGFCKTVAIDPRVIKTFESSYSTELPVEVDLLLKDLRYARIDELLEALGSWRQIGIGGALSGR